MDTSAQFFLGWWLAGEKVTVNVAIAAALVILAVFLVDRGAAGESLKL